MNTNTKTNQTGEGNAPRVEIREGGMPEGFGQFHVYTDGLYHCSCRTRAEAERVISERFQRDELLAALKIARIYVDTLNGEYFTRETQIRESKLIAAAIAKAEGSK